MADKAPDPTFSPDETQTGTALGPGLYLVATPIGHAQDITLRALSILRTADLILAEDTRNTRKLLAIHGVGNRVETLHEYNEDAACERVLQRLKDGMRIALVSDAGTPLISDPGFRLVRAAIEAGIPITHAPGPSSVLSALVLSGLPPDRFFYCGFLPPKQAARRRALEAARSVPATLIFLEGRTRVAEALLDMAEILGPRPAALARELTKLHEEVRRASLDKLAEALRTGPVPLGEMVIVIGPPADQPETDQDTLDRALVLALGAASLSQAVTEVARELALPRNKVYRRALELSKKAGTKDP